LLDDEAIVIDFKLADGASSIELSEDVLLSQVIINPQTEAVAVSAEKQSAADPDESVAAILEVDNAVTTAPFLEEDVADEIVPEPIVTIIEQTADVHEDSAEIKHPVVAEPDIVQPLVEPSGRVAGGVRTNGSAQGDAVDVKLDESPLRAMQAHAVSSMRREVAGILVGPQPEKQPNGRYVVHVVDSIIAKHTRMSGASVTYTPESWRYVNDTLAEMYPAGDMVIVGWYHTHPGFGIFLSGMDLFIHENFFTQPWHIAYVLDPVARRSGFFCWDRLQKRVKEFDLEWPNWSRHSW
jgi:proteasome lid subunit RPN8/RPN11